MDWNERPDLADLAPGGSPDGGYRAGGRLGDGQVRRTRGIGIALAAVIALGVALSAFTNDGTGLASLPGDVSSTSRPTGAAEGFVPSPTSNLGDGVDGDALEWRPVPMFAGWLRWLNPATGDFQGEARSTGEADPTLTFVDASGAAVQVCGAFPPRISGDAVLQLDICAFDADGAQVGRRSLRTLDARFPPMFDATVSADGRWLWLASAQRLDAHWVLGDDWHVGADWHVTIDRVDLTDLSMAASRVIRIIPVSGGPFSVENPSAEGWLVAELSVVRPVVRASPDGSRLSLTMTEVPRADTVTFLLQQERVELDSSLESAGPVEVVFPVFPALDLACDASRSAWATSRHYLTLCSHPEPNGDSQPFVRIETSDEITRDVAIGPPVLTNDHTTDDSSWLLDAQRGKLYRWSHLRQTFTVLDVATRAGTMVIIDPSGPSFIGLDWPASDPGSGLLAWSSLDGGAPSGSPNLRLAGTRDGSVLYALGLVPTPPTGALPLVGFVLAIDASSAQVLGRWTAPGPVDQIALAPGDGPLVEFLTPGLTRRTRDPSGEWTTVVWFADPRTGAQLKVLGPVRGSGSSAPTMLQPAVAAFAGF